MSEHLELLWCAPKFAIKAVEIKRLLTVTEILGDNHHYAEFFRSFYFGHMIGLL